jgi:HSP20 family protein
MIKWQPLEDLHSLRSQINRLFDDIVNEEPLFDRLASLPETPWVPAIELQETETGLVLKAQVPGIDPGQLDIKVSDNAVFLAGECPCERKTQAHGLVRSEFYYGQFKRVIPLPAHIQRERVQASIADGILTLTMLKSAPTVPHVVKVPLTAADKTAVEAAAHHNSAT